MRYWIKVDVKIIEARADLATRERGNNSCNRLVARDFLSSNLSSEIIRLYPQPAFLSAILMGNLNILRLFGSTLSSKAFRESSTASSLTLSGNLPEIAQRVHNEGGGRSGISNFITEIPFWDIQIYFWNYWKKESPPHKRRASTKCLNRTLIRRAAALRMGYF